MQGRMLKPGGRNSSKSKRSSKVCNNMICVKSCMMQAQSAWLHIQYWLGKSMHMYAYNTHSVRVWLSWNTRMDPWKHANTDGTNRALYA
jgi:hypothetical protein